MHDWNDMLANLGASVGAEVIGRESSPLRQEEWEAIDKETVEVVRRQIVFRPLLSKYGILRTDVQGAGVTQIKRYEQVARKAAKTDMSGEPEEGDFSPLKSATTPVPIHHAAGHLDWRMLESSRRGSEPLDVTEPIRCAIEVQEREDTFWALGDSDLGIDGLLNPTNRQTFAGGNWTADPNTIWDKIAEADEKLNDDSGATFQGDRVLFVSASERRKMNKRYGSGSDTTPAKQLIESGLVKEIVTVSTSIRAAGTATLVAMNPAYQKASLTVDIRTDPLPSMGRNPRFVTWGAGTFQAKKPRSVVELTGIT